MSRSFFLASAAAPCLLLAFPTAAQVRGTDATDDRTDATIVVTGQRDPLKLDDQAQASSRL